MDGIKDALSKKILGLPGWVWLIIGVGLFFFLSTRKSSTDSSDASSQYSVSTPTGDQMTANAVSDLKTTLQDQFDDKFGEITEANAAANAGTQDQLSAFMASQANWFQQFMDKEAKEQDAMMGAINTNNQNYMDALAKNNQNFIDALKAMLQSGAGNSTAPTQTNNTDPFAGLPSWVKDRLNSSYWQSRKYVKKDDSTLGQQYGDAVNWFLRSDNPTGMNSGGSPPQSAIDQLNQLIAQGLVAKNPYYNG